MKKEIIEKILEEWNVCSCDNSALADRLIKEFSPEGEYIKKADMEKILYTTNNAVRIGELFTELPTYSSPDSENKGWWIPFSEELPPKGKKVHVSTFGIVTIGERTSDANEALRLSILEPMNNMYKNIDPYSYQITHWQPLPEPYKKGE